MNTSSDLQQIAIDFFESKQTGNQTLITKLYNKYYNSFYDIVYSTAMSIIRDGHKASEIANNVLCKMWFTDSYIFDYGKSHKSYLRMISANASKAVFNKDKKSRYVSESTFVGSGSQATDQGNDFLDVLNAHYINTSQEDGLIGGSSISILELENNRLLREGFLEALDHGVEVLGDKTINFIPTFTKQEKRLLRDYYIGNKTLTELVNQYKIQSAEGRSPENILKQDIKRLKNKVHRILKNREMFSSVSMMINSHVSNTTEIAEDEDKTELISNILTIIKELDKENGTYHTDEDGSHRGVLFDAMYNDLPYKQIAQIYNLNTVGCIKTRVNRAKHKILQEIDNAQAILDWVENKNTTVSCTGKVFFDGGNVKSKINIKDGELHGLVTNFYKDGTLNEEINYRMGFRNGTYKKYDQSGSLIIQGYYRNNVKDGEWRYYDLEDGLLAISVEFEDGEPSYGVKYDKSGEIIESIFIRPDNGDFDDFELKDTCYFDEFIRGENIEVQV